jgi:hypothetical protein
MSLTAYEGRTLPSVFSDISNRNAEVQKVRRQLGWRTFWLGVFFIVALALVGGLIYTVRAWEQAKQDARDYRAERDALTTQNEDIGQIMERRTQIARTRQALFEKIEGQPQWRDQLWRSANDAWRRAGQTGNLSLQNPTEPVPQRWMSRAWPAAQDQAYRTMGTEVDALRAVNTAVDNKMRDLRTNGPRPCNPDPRQPC